MLVLEAMLLLKSGHIDCGSRWACFRLALRLARALRGGELKPLAGETLDLVESEVHTGCWEIKSFRPGTAGLPALTMFAFRQAGPPCPGPTR